MHERVHTTLQEKINYTSRGKERKQEENTGDRRMREEELDGETNEERRPTSGR